jgi:hypothetical protein
VVGPQTPPYWAHCVENYKVLSRGEAEAVFPGMTHGASFRTIIYNTTYAISLTKPSAMLSLTQLPDATQDVHGARHEGGAQARRSL